MAPRWHARDDNDDGLQLNVLKAVVVGDCALQDMVLEGKEVWGESTWCSSTGRLRPGFHSGTGGLRAGHQHPERRCGGGPVVEIPRRLRLRAGTPHPERQRS